MDVVIKCEGNGDPSGNVKMNILTKNNKILILILILILINIYKNN
jgi:hypothetical protein